MAPVVQELYRRGAGVRGRVCVTAQHRELLDDVLELFGIVPHHDLGLMRVEQSPSDVAAAVLRGLEPILNQERPDWVLVQGDTTTTMAAAIAAFHARCRVAHVEAGLRSGDLRHPWPEEANRRVTTLLADLHFAPTGVAKKNLLREGVPSERISITGNPGIDALHLAIMMPWDARSFTSEAVPQDKRILLVTAHRRESFGRPLKSICQALRQIANLYQDQIQIVYPVHPNPRVTELVDRMLRGYPAITLLEHLGYLSMVQLLRRSYFVLTDSGGLQEEAPGLGKPVLVLRDTTERSEAVEAGNAMLVGCETDAIVAAARMVLENRDLYRRMAQPRNIFGDGNAARRIVSAILAGCCCEARSVPTEAARPELAHHASAGV
jgi:UDP-N-acetylglucosamine 2-epimerase (non-hydrolysing)